MDARLHLRLVGDTAPVPLDDRALDLDVCWLPWADESRTAHRSEALSTIARQLAESAGSMVRALGGLTLTPSGVRYEW
jgi:hypothetical protein